METNKIQKKDLLKVYVRTFFHQGSWNYERMQALGYCFDLIPVLNKIYDKKGDRFEAYKRHLEYFNTHQFMANPILGVNIALEEKIALGGDIDDGAVNAVKIGLMGPLAGVGDPVFLGTLRPLLAALGASFALQGNFLGPLLFFLLFNVIRLGFMWYSLDFGYQKGLSLLADISGNALKKLTEGASVLGLFIMGALVNQWTSINVPLVITRLMVEGKEVVTTVQNVLDELVPGILALGLTFACMKLLNKKISPIVIIFILFFIGIIGNYFGILG